MDDDLEQYPHVFFTSPDIWNAFVLDHGIAPAHLDEINQDEADDSLPQDSILEDFGDKWYCTWECSVIQAQ